MDPLARLLEELSDPAAYPAEDWAGVAPEARRVTVVQTHISVVFLTARRAYKVKKPLALWGLVDYSTPAARKHWCVEEVRLNRRLADDVYLGVVAIRERGTRLVVAEMVAEMLAEAVGEAEGAPRGAAQEPPVEHAVCMRRFRLEDTLEQRVLEGRAPPATLTALGRRLAAFHSTHRLAGRERAALRLGLYAGVLLQNMHSTRAFVPTLWSAKLHGALERLLVGGLLRQRARLRARIAGGLAVDGHGDVRLEHVLVEPGLVESRGVEPGRAGESEHLSVVDAVEFTTRLRHIDPLSDPAFLWMELLSRGRSDLGEAFLQGYGVAAMDRDLLIHFAAYRAHVRAKVGATTASAAEVPPEQRERAAQRARGHLALAWTLARRGVAPAPLVLLRGPSGSGKSVLASALAPWLDAEVVRSDLVRKELFGLGALERPQAAAKATLYGSVASERTYAEVLRRGLAVVATGRAALLDATYLLERARRPVLAAAAALGVPCLIVDLEVAPEVARERLRARALRDDDASDADIVVYEEQVRTAEPLVGAELGRRLAYGAGSDPAALLLRLCEQVEALAPAPPAGPWAPCHKGREPRPPTG